MKAGGTRLKLGQARPPAAFTLVEFLIASGIAVLLVAGLAVFLQGTGVSMLSVSHQSSFNQEAGHATEFLINRIRLANSATNDAVGDTLTLSYDDNPEVDSDGDKVAWNDLDHFEQFRFETVDGNPATLDDNTLTYRAQAPGGSSSPLVRSGVRKLPKLPVFSVTNRATVRINFGLLSTNQGPRSQAIEIRTSGRLRNRLQ